MRQCSEINRSEGGFTLLEVTLALAMGVMLIVAIFSVAVGTIQMTTEVSSFQSTATRNQAFVSLVRRTFLQLNPEGRVGLIAGGDGTQLIIDQDPGAFSFGPFSRGASRIVMFQTNSQDGTRLISLKYLNEEEAQRMDEGDFSGMGTQLDLLSGVSEFNWAFYDANANEWLTEWKLDQGRPSLIELKMTTDISSSRTVFWVPRFISSNVNIGSDVPVPGAENPENPESPETPETTPTP